MTQAKNVIFMVVNAWNIVKKIIPIILLIFVLLMLLTWVNIVKCGDIPGWCSVYYGIMGQPDILIMYGTDGIGDPFKLKALFEDRTVLTIKKRVDIKPLDYMVDYSKISGYDLVIVDRAKTMTYDEMKIFFDYANKGGRLVWIGDSGTSAPANEKPISEKDVNPQSTTDKDYSGWIRANIDGDVLNFSELISVEFLGNFCDLKNCANPYTEYIGKMLAEGSSSLTKQMLSTAKLYGTFSLVKTKKKISTTVALMLDYQSHLITNGGEDLGNIQPLIVSSGLGGKVAYYAVPPEHFFDFSGGGAVKITDFVNTGMYYGVLVENLYYGMLE